MIEPDERFSANVDQTTAGTTSPTAPATVLDREDAERRLMETIGELEELQAQAAESAPAELSPTIVALLERFSGQPDASLESQSLHRRVAAGSLTWREFWRAPQDHPGGVALWSQVQEGRMRVATVRSKKQSTTSTTTPTEAS